MSCKSYINRPDKVNDFYGIHATDTISQKEVTLKDRIKVEFGDSHYWIAEDDDGQLVIVNDYNLENFYYWD